MWYGFLVISCVVFGQNSGLNGKHGLLGALAWSVADVAHLYFASCGTPTCDLLGFCTHASVLSWFSCDWFFVGPYGLRPPGFPVCGILHCIAGGFFTIWPIRALHMLCVSQGGRELQACTLPICFCPIASLHLTYKGKLKEKVVKNFRTLTTEHFSLRMRPKNGGWDHLKSRVPSLTLIY